MHRPLLRRTGRAKYEAPQLDFKIAKAAYFVASTRDLSKIALPGVERGAPSYTAAIQALREQVAANPSMRGELQVVTEFVAEETVP
jgi:hypothetical protein